LIYILNIRELVSLVVIYLESKISFTTIRVYHCNLLLLIKRGRLKRILLQFFVIQISEPLINQIFKLLIFIYKSWFSIFHNLWLLLNFKSITLNSVILVHSIIMCICWEIYQCRLSLRIFRILNHCFFLVLIFSNAEWLVIICNFTLRVLLWII